MGTRRKGSKKVILLLPRKTERHHITLEASESGANHLQRSTFSSNRQENRTKKTNRWVYMGLIIVSFRVFQPASVPKTKFRIREGYFRAEQHRAHPLQVRRLHRLTRTTREKTTKKASGSTRG